jgi:RNA polymerase sigma-70 factor (ECF subfamily)
MSIDATYFEDALATTLARLGEGHCTSEGPSESLDILQSRSDVVEQTVGTIRAEFAVSSSEISDEQMLKQISEGEKEALALLFRRHARSVRNVAYRILRDEAEADDLVQEVFLFIFRKAVLFESAHGPAGSWIFQVVYHRAFDRRRYLNTRRFASQELKDTSLHLADPRREVLFHEQSMEGILGKRLMVRFNAKLTPEQRETIQLYFFEGYTLKEIAELTGRSLVNVRSHYYRGLERLRRFVKPEKLRSG